MKGELDRVLVEMKDQVNKKDEIWKKVVGCDGECPFCGARCTEDIKCERTGDRKKNHNTMYHRPMAFKGTNEKETNEQGV